VTPGFFPWYPRDPWADSASKSEYQDIPGSKGGRYIKLTTYHLHVPIFKKSGGLNLLESYGRGQACSGTALHLTEYRNKYVKVHRFKLLRQIKIMECVSLYVTDLLYRKKVTVKNTPLEVEILDVSGETVSF